MDVGNHELSTTDNKWTQFLGFLWFFGIFLCIFYRCVRMLNSGDIDDSGATSQVCGVRKLLLYERWSSHYEAGVFKYSHRLIKHP